MSQEFFQKLLEKTIGNIEIIKNMASILNQFKDQIPCHIYNRALSQGKDQIKNVLISRGFSSDQKLQKLLDSMKSKNFDLKKYVIERFADLKSYYQLNEHGQLEQYEDLVEESPIPKLKKKTKSIKKNKKGKQAKPKVQTQIYEQSLDQVQNFMII